MIEILKASAGSGKTFSLAKEYISLLVCSDDPYKYRHILAVTFTNKATDEMKQRILKELDILASIPEKSLYINDFKSLTGKSTSVISTMARKILCNILNDYGAFSVSTIDTFFQRALKAFSREIGQFSSYQVELDKNSLVTESVDRLLDALTEDNSGLISWLTDSVKEQLIAAGKFSLERSLYEMAIALRSEEHREAVERLHADSMKMYSKENLSALKKKCNSIIRNYSDDVKAKADEILKILESLNIGTTMFSGGSRSFMNQLYKYSELKGREIIKQPTKTFMENAIDSQKWFSRQNSEKFLALTEGALEGPLAEFCDMFADRYEVYRTASILLGQIYSLGLTREMDESFNTLMKEKNVLCLDDSNAILKGIIDGSDTPFIYEKIGVRYDNFLLDEFQDTSCIQWDNFRPLLMDSVASGNLNLIVGDVKQSIYRWRNSDWNLLNTKLEEDFPLSKVRILDSNWRSLPEIVSFNNKFYKYASSCLSEITGVGIISGIYADVCQASMASDGDAVGNVDVIFCRGMAGEDLQMNMLLKEISRLQDSGAKPSDIGILVRTNTIGANVASALLQEGIPVISDDSLTVKSSPAVRRLVSLLSYANNPDDGLNTYLAGFLGIEPPEEYNSLTDLCEFFVRGMKSGSDISLEGEVPYIQAFMDVVQDWTKIYGNSLPEFLAYWDTVDPKISSPDDADAVRVMTIHKSKGLAFPYVIFPYSDNVNLFKPSEHWCHPCVEGTELESVADGVYRVNLSSDMENTLFSKDYMDEKYMQYVDALNTYYVATTRAQKGMTIISPMPSDNWMKNMSKEGGVKSFSNMSQLLFWYIHDRSSDCEMKAVADGAENHENNGCEHFRIGVPYRFKSTEHHSEGVAVTDYSSMDLNGRLEFSTEASDFFSEDGPVGLKASEGLKGIVLHDILSEVVLPSDLEKAVDAAYEDGRLDVNEKKIAMDLLSLRISSAVERGWFPDDPKAVINEASLIDVDGNVYRPDRVVILDGKVTIIDYKFGHQEKKYYNQVRKYAMLYHDMGYEDVSAVLWFVHDDKVIIAASESNEKLSIFVTEN